MRIVTDMRQNFVRLHTGHFHIQEYATELTMFTGLYRLDGIVSIEGFQHITYLGLFPKNGRHIVAHG